MRGRINSHQGCGHGCRKRRERCPGHADIPSEDDLVIYRVTAQFKPATAEALRRQLDDGSIAAQQPDGQEMVDSLHRAVLRDNDEVVWSEQCYCTPPLAHERATILDRYFDVLATEAIEDYEAYEGRPFMEYLAAMVDELESSHSVRVRGN